MGANVNDPAPETEGQTGGSPQVQDSQQQPTGLDSESFTDVDLSTIDRDTLSPDMQQAYDKLVERLGNMNKHFTQTQQGLKARESEFYANTRDAEAWRGLMNHPEAREFITHLITTGETPPGVSAGRGEEQLPRFSDIEHPEENPWEAIRLLTAEEIGKALDTRLGPMEQAFQQITGNMSANQANLEFENLKVKYPALGADGMRERLNIVRSQFKDTSGRAISMEKALGVLAVANPNILLVQQPQPQAQTSGQAPTGQQGAATTGQKPNTGVEKPDSTGAGGAVPPLPIGVKKLQARLKEKIDAGTSISIEAVAENLREMWRTRGG